MATDLTDSDFTDSDDGDWDELELVTNEDNLITTVSTHQAPSIMQAHRLECWQCPKCNTINNIHECIKEHGSKCVGCQDECYIESQTETIIQTQYHSNNHHYLLQIEQLWQCKSCLTINDLSNPNCIQCDKPSIMTIIRRDIKKFTPKQKDNHLIRGFVRELGHYFHTWPTMYSDLFQLIETYYDINNGYIINNVKCMSNIRALSLKVGDKLDHRYTTGKFEPAQVTDVNTKDNNCKFKLRYEGFLISTTFTWYDYNADPLKFAEAGAVSTRPAHRLKAIKVGDKVDVNPNKKRNGWKGGEIKEIDDKSGQVKVEYKFGATTTTCWTHLDNEEEISEFGLRTGNKVKTISDLLTGNADKHERGNIDLGNQW